MSSSFLWRHRASHRWRHGLWPIGHVVALFLLNGCSDAAPTHHDERRVEQEQRPGPVYRAVIQRTQHGIPHITAPTLGSAGFGQGYALAEDHACTLADQILKVHGERAKYLGEGPRRVHVVSDFAYRLLNLTGRAEETFAKQPPVAREVLEGYAAGFNRYLTNTGVQNVPGYCKGQPWVRPITAKELFAYHINLALTGSASRLIAAIGLAQPPGQPATAMPDPAEATARVREREIGSNGWAIGASRSKSGLGMLLSNPHFPWEGELRLWESHLTVPGELDVYGATLIGFPGVMLGFNRDVAWTHTFSAGYRFTGYALRLVRGHPTHYMYGNEERAMTEHPFTIAVRQPDGSVKDESRTYYTTHYGPVLSLPSGLPGEPFVWNTESAIAYRDANWDNTSFTAQFQGMDRARSLEEFQSVFASVQGTGWINTMATDRDGHTWYTDASATPNLHANALARLERDLADPTTVSGKAFAAFQIIVLDGSDPSNEWVEEDGARAPGLVPYARLPQLSRNDFVFNANDSHWLANPAEPLVGYSFLHGFERRPQSPRTRMNVKYLTEIAENGASGADGKFTLEELKATVLSNRSLTSEMLLPQVVDRCRGKATGHHGGQVVDITQACTLLSQWNGRFDLDSVGAVVWREFMGAYTGDALVGGGDLFATPFDPAHPIATPHTLKPAPAEGDDPLLDKLAQAVQTLKAANVPLDAPLGNVQFIVRGKRKQRFGLHGSNGREGTTNVMTYGTANNSSAEDRYSVRGAPINAATGLSAEGYVVNYGSSFILAMEYAPNGGVRANALLTYGETGDQDARNFTSQTELFLAKRWRKVLFSPADIAADPGLTTQVIEQ
ncbi:penicillin acylase family protein [Pendulispora brunnea]|uniref:Penicillin acylase family protein n=1 Tax=Pendulispora brunnea TaxID=2905690 RepID=A0ABZ2K7W6_9BACT